VGGAGNPRIETLAATIGRTLPAGLTVVDNGAVQVGVWRVPHDPELPGLPAAMDPVAMAALLSRFGLGGGPARPRLRAYRPRRRAVAEVTARPGRLFIKAVRPGRARELHGKHRLLAAAGLPVPQSIGWTGDGLLVLQALPGTTLRDVLFRSDGPWPQLGALTELLDRLPAELATGPPRQSWAGRAGEFAVRIGAAVPDLGPRAHKLAGMIGAGTVLGPVVATHGEFYERQLLVAGTRVSGLLDVDTAGPGDRLDDLACLLGHLSVLRLVWPQRAETISALADGYLRELDRHVDPAQLRLRTAAVVLSLATGPHRVQEPGWRQSTRQRLDLVEQWLEQANTPDPSPAPVSPAGAGILARPHPAAHH
jgi:hypothetical protein